jgi:hypothetical protein
MKRSYYTASLADFQRADMDAITGQLSRNSEGSVLQSQIDAWEYQIRLLKAVLQSREGQLFFEFSIPRMGKRIDVVLVVGAAVFVIEFKVGAAEFSAAALAQVYDYGLDLKNFHEPSHHCCVAPILLASDAEPGAFSLSTTAHGDQLLTPIQLHPSQLNEAICAVVDFAEGPAIDAAVWEGGRYLPTPTIVEAALALYRGHSVADISRSDAGARNLHETTHTITQIIQDARDHGNKAICFVTGVPGAGKTLVGLNIATKHLDHESNLFSVFLSGNGPLVAVLQEALARDLVARRKAEGKRLSKREALSEVKAFVQIVHHYRDAYLRDERAPADHVALFDEAQRAWNLQKTQAFMKQKKNRPDFHMSEPEFLISCVDRHEDWGVVVCLVGGGQEIHTGEAGIGEWVEALLRSYPKWHIHISSKLTDTEYGAGSVLEKLQSRPSVYFRDDLHLSTSMRSFRAENVSALVKELLDQDVTAAHTHLNQLSDKYPIMITRDLALAKRWLRQQARGSERYGMVVSSQAERLRPHAIHVKSEVNPVHWFLHDRDDVRSSYYLEDVATEFSIQGLELDWTCVVWDADFRFKDGGWDPWSFRGSRWERIRQSERKNYLKNAYRVLLTRARQGMVIVVPPGDADDPTRPPGFYDPTYEYLKSVGFTELTEKV